MDLLKSMWLDGDPINQPADRARRAVNVVYNKALGALTQEGGNKLIDSLPSNHLMINFTILPDQTFLIFSTDNSNSEIGKFDGKEYTTILNNSSLNFSTDYLIDTEIKVNLDNEYIVYWSDDLNPDRFLNITKLPTINDISQLNLSFSLSDSPTIELEDVIDNVGILKAGGYIVSIALIDKEDYKTDYVSNTNTIVISDADLSNSTEYEGAEPETVTRKAIKLSISNIDQNYRYLSVVYTPIFAGVSESPRELDPVEISSDSLELTIYGDEPYEEISSADILIPVTTVYKSSKHNTQIDNTLYRAGLTSKNITLLQPYVNSLIISSVTKDLADPRHQALPKNAYYDRTFMFDEVYAIYISFILDGKETQKYHIPGRVSGGNETQNLSTSPRASSNNAIAIDANAKNFHVYSEDNGNGMGYWENDTEVYPDNNNWDGSISGPDLSGQKVRHHKFLENSENPYFKSSNTPSILGIKVSGFNNIPSSLKSRITGYKIYYAKRGTGAISNFGTSLLLGCETLTDIGGNTTVYTEPFVPNAARSSYNTKAAQVFLFDFFKELKDPNNINYVKFIAKAGGGHTGFTMVTEDTIDHYRGTFDLLSNINNSVDENLYIRVVENIENVLDDDTDYLDENNFNYDTIEYNNVADDLKVSYSTFIEFKNSFNTLATSFRQSNTGTNNEAHFIVSCHRFTKDMYKSFDRQVLEWTGYTGDINNNESNEIYGGDCYITEYPTILFRGHDGSYPGQHTIGYTTPVISRYNLNLIYEDVDTIHYPKNLLSQVIKQTKQNFNYQPEFNLLSRYVNSEVDKFDEEPRTKFNYRVIRSQKSGNESGDNWRNYLANDYVDIPTNFGPITNLERFNNTLIIHTERALLYTKGNQQLSVDDIRAYVGSGDIFAIPPEEIISTNEGYAGSTSKTSCINTPFGYFFVDRRAGKVYLFQGKPMEISKAGFRNFFFNNLKSELEDYGYVYPENPLDGFGITSVYDYKYERIILTKLDKKPTDLFKDLFNNEPGGESPWIVYNSNSNLFVLRTPTQSGVQDSPLSFDDADYFVDSSFTISYFPDNEGWVSWHSYLPYSYMQNINKYFSLQENKIYQHNIEDSLTKYYEQAYNFYIDVVRNPSPDIDKLLVYIKMNTLKRSSNGGFVDGSFDQMIIWNRYQCSGVINLQDNKILRRVNQDWLINEFRDLVIDKSKPFIVNNELDETNIDYNKVWFMQTPFLDKYIIIRLEALQSDNNSLYLYGVEAAFKADTRKP